MPGALRLWDTAVNNKPSKILVFVMRQSSSLSIGKPRWLTPLVRREDKSRGREAVMKEVAYFTWCSSKTPCIHDVDGSLSQ